MVAFLMIVALVASFTSITLAHPGEALDQAKTKREVEFHRRVAVDGSERLSKCAKSLGARWANDVAANHRMARLQEIYRSEGFKEGKIMRRSMEDLKKWEMADHDKTGESFSNNPRAIFGEKPSCILAPETTVGPFYYPEELVRTQIHENQDGVKMWLDVRLVDVNTCKPIENFFVDIWGTNATGSYSHIPSELTDPPQGGRDTHYQRGAWRTDKDGTVTFFMNFPGHYTGRATHLHIMARDNVKTSFDQNMGEEKVSGNEWDNNVHHIGQIFFNPALVDAVEKVGPYTGNKQPFTKNDDDGWAGAQATADYDPLVNYVLLNGRDVSGGIFTWLSIGIDPEASQAQHFFKDDVRPWK